jgi:DNA-binding response OmpR family regulator
MDPDLNTRQVTILYIGLRDPAFDKLWEQLPREGLGVAFARTQEAGLELAASLQPRAVVINLVEAQFLGGQLSQILRRRMPSIQRLVIADRDPAAARVPCEKRLTRPFTLRRLRDTLFELLQEDGPHLIVAGRLELDVVGRVVSGPNGRRHLTPKQCSLLTVFMQHANQAISRKELMDRVWDTAYLGDTRTLDAHIRWLREKIEIDPTRPSLLKTERGIGYVLAIDEQPTE